MFRIETIEHERLKRGWSKRQLAAVAQVHPKTISDVLARRNQFAPTVKKLAEAVGLRLEDLVIEEEEPASAGK